MERWITGNANLTSASVPAIIIIITIIIINPVMLVLVLKDQNAVLVLVPDDAVLVLAAEVLVLEQKSLVMSLMLETDSRTDVVDFESIAFTVKFD